MTLHRTIIAAAVVALAVAPATSARTTTLTKDQAFARASTCLKNHGAKTIIPRAFNLGGIAQYGGTTRGSAVFKYEVTGDQAVGVHLWFAGSSGPTKLQRQWAQRCVTWGVPLVR